MSEEQFIKQNKHEGQDAGDKEPEAPLEIEELGSDEPEPEEAAEDETERETGEKKKKNNVFLINLEEEKGQARKLGRAG